MATPDLNVANIDICMILMHDVVPIGISIVQREIGAENTSGLVSTNSEDSAAGRARTYKGVNVGSIQIARCDFRCNSRAVRIAASCREFEKGARRAFFHTTPSTIALTMPLQLYLSDLPASACRSVGTEKLNVDLGLLSLDIRHSNRCNGH